MKRTLLALLIVTIVVAGAAFGIAYWFRCRSCATAKPNLVRELNLSADQAAKLAQLEAAYQKRLDDICAAHCAARSALAEALPDEAKAAEHCAQMCAAQADSEKAALEHIFQVRALLTPEQQPRHTELVRQQLAGACPMRMHQP